MSLLIAVKSCRKDFRAGAHEVIRSTWGQRFRGVADVRFFLGKESGNPNDHANLKSDEVMLPSDDSFLGLPWKVHDICQWAVGKLYTHIFLCDNDTYINPSKLIASDFRRHDYQGFFNRPLEDGRFDYSDKDPNGVLHHYPRCYPWASGGRGYFLSRSAFMTVSEAFPNKNEWAEDLWVGQVLGPGASLGEFTVNSVPDGVYSWHYPVERGYNPASGWMVEMHEAHRG